jgi:putative component of membrane protein insertase Oxa1/YidC/SpoIIIJ protein YidD
VHKSRVSVARAPKVCMVAPHINGHSVWNLFHAALMAHRIVSLIFETLWTSDGGCIVYNPACAQYKVEVLNNSVSKPWTLNLINAEKSIILLSEFISWRSRYAFTLSQYAAGTGRNTLLPVVSRI